DGFRGGGDAERDVVDVIPAEAHVEIVTEVSLAAHHRRRSSSTNRTARTGYKVPRLRARGARRERQRILTGSSINAAPPCTSPRHRGAPRRRAASRTGQPVGA